MSGAPAETPDEGGARAWWDAWPVKVGVWSVPVIFSAGAIVYMTRALAQDVTSLKAERVEEVRAEGARETRLSVLEEKVRRLEELDSKVSKTSDNVLVLCSASGVQCTR